MTITEEIAALRELDVSALVARYEQEFGKRPRVKQKTFLWKRIAWKVQERQLGGLSDLAKRRLEELIAEIKLPVEDQHRTITGKLTGATPPAAPSAGTTLTRVWRGREVRATVVDGGFECGGVLYTSLSAVAKAVTGAHWNGRLFFGLTARNDRRATEPTT